MFRKNTKQLKLDLKNKANSHPDPSRRNLYKILSQIIEDRSSTIGKLLINSYTKRRNIDSTHYANVICHAFEQFYLEGEIEPEKSYTQFDKKDWEKQINQISLNPNHLKKVQSFLTTNRTQTNKFQRYLGPKILINLYFGEKPITVIDAGCSINLGLMGLASNEHFFGLRDNTRQSYISQQMNVSVNIKEGIGIDIHDPNENEKWILACNFYPSESHQLNDFVARVTRLKKTTPNIRFIKGDIIKIRDVLRKHKIRKVDVVIMSTVLYQLNPRERKKAIEGAREVLNKNGIIIVNDFVNIRKGKLSWTKNWFGSAPSF